MTYAPVKREFFTGLLEKLGLWTVLAATVLYSIPPWRSYFFDGLGKHWDTKVMGYWMAWNAHNIFKGNILIPRFDANFFYPHLHTLAFGEMLWPESFVYAALWGPTHNLFLAFNGTMLFFWALAGVCMYMLLRELQVCRTVSWLAGFIFCLTPFMMAFYIEFNMTLVFVIPLMLLLTVRWLRKPDFGRALGFCAGFLVSLTSCIYYTFMVAFPIAFVAVAHLAANRALLRQKKFYLTAALIVAGVLAVSAIYLRPYIQLRIEGGYSRNMQDFMISHAQPLMYLDTRSSALIWHLFTPPRRWSETYLFPGSVLALLSMLYFGHGTICFMRRRTWQHALPAGVGVAKFVLWSGFWAIILANAYFRQFLWVSRSAPLLYPLSLALLITYLGTLLLPGQDTPQKILAAGLAAGAVMCFFISLGPVITVGYDSHLIKLARAPLARLFESTPVFGVVRGLTRFAVIVLVYLIVSSSLMLDRAVRAQKRLIWLFPILIAILVFEGVHMKYRYEHYADLYNSTTMQQARSLPDDSVLFQIPTTPKFISTNIVMNTIGDFHYLVNGMSGFLPRQFTELNGLLRSWKIGAATRRLRRIWPQTYLLIDRPATAWLASGWRKPFPWKKLSHDWRLVHQDRQYALYRLRPKTAVATRIARRIRPDVLQKKRLLTFSARQGDLREGPGRGFRVLLNGHAISRRRLTDSWQPYRILLPTVYMGNLEGDQVTLELLPADLPAAGNCSRHGWEVRRINFEAPVASRTP